MRALTTVALVVAGSLAGAQAFAAPVHLNDVQFIEANRCVGLMSSKALGTPDVAAMKQVVKISTGGRMGFVYDKADQAREEAQRQADRTGSADARLVAERDGLCHSLLEANSGGGGSQAATLR